MEELLQWPWQRFEAFYAAFVKAQVIESLERRKEAMVQALWSNSNYDDKEGTRQNAIQEIEESFADAIVKVQGGVKEEEVEIDKNDPFFSPTFKAMAKLEEPQDPTKNVAAVIAQEADYTRFIDQG